MNMGRPQKFDPFWSLAGGRGLQVDAMDPVQIWINPPGIRKIWDKHADKTAKKGGGATHDGIHVFPLLNRHGWKKLN